MGLFKKKECEFCGEKIGIFNRGKRFKDGELCSDCSTELSPNWIDTAKFEISDAIEHIEERKKNIDVLKNSFHPDSYFGFRPTLFVDNENRLFCLTLGGAREGTEECPRYIMENSDLFSFSQLEDTQIFADESDNHKLMVTIKNHPWATKLIFKDRIALNYQDMLAVDAELRRISYIDK